METQTQPKHHILMIPFLAHGHFRPFLQLAHRLHSRTHFTITLLTTPLNAHHLSSTTPTTTGVHIATLPFTPTDHGLPPNIENTSKIPLPLVVNLFHSTVSLQPHLLHFIHHHFFSSHPPLCIIFDTFLGWAADVARQVGSTPVGLTTCGAYGTAAYSSVWLHLPHRHLSTNEEDFPVPGFPDNHRFRCSQLHRFVRHADGSDPWSRFFQPQLRLSMNCFGWLCNSVEEIEPLGFSILRRLVNLPMWAVGPLITDKSSGSRASKDDNGDINNCIEWLNTQKKDSVLYISFGSQNTISPAQMMELAYGLEMSGKPFLWVIRPPLGFDLNGEMRPEWLPEGFEERVVKGRKQGLLVDKWGPQLRILGHEVTGGFLTHCGWNSVLEALREGVPMLGWPLAAEQSYNSKLMEEEMGVGVELARGLEGEVGRERVKRVVEMVLEREEGSKGWMIKCKAVEMKEKLEKSVMEDGEFKGSSVKAVDEFVDAILSARSRIQDTAS